MRRGEAEGNAEEVGGDAGVAEDMEEEEKRKDGSYDDTARGHETARQLARPPAPLPQTPARRAPEPQRSRAAVGIQTFVHDEYDYRSAHFPPVQGRLPCLPGPSCAKPVCFLLAAF